MDKTMKFRIPDENIDADELLKIFKGFLNVVKQFNKDITFVANVEKGSNVFVLQPQEHLDNVSFIENKKNIENIFRNIQQGKKVFLPKYKMLPVSKLIDYAKKNDYNFSIDEELYNAKLLYSGLNGSGEPLTKKDITIPKNKYTMLCTIKGVIYQIGNAKRKSTKEFTVIEEEEERPIRCIFKDIDESYSYLKEKEKVLITGEIDFDLNNFPRLMRVDFLRKNTGISLQ